MCNRSDWTRRTVSDLVPPFLDGEHSRSRRELPLSPKRGIRSILVLAKTTRSGTPAFALYISHSSDPRTAWAGTSPNRTNRRRSNLPAWASGSCCSSGTHRKTGTRPLASFLPLHVHRQDRSICSEELDWSWFAGSKPHRDWRMVLVGPQSRRLRCRDAIGRNRPTRELSDESCIRTAVAQSRRVRSRNSGTLK